MILQRGNIQKQLYKLPLLLVAFILAGIAALPMIVPGDANAAGQILHRALTTSSGVPSKTGVGYTYTFKTVATASPIQGAKFIACTTAVGTYIGGTCTAPAGLTFASATYTAGSQAGFTDAGAFALDATGANSCTPAANILCINRTSATNDTQTSTDKTLAFANVTNPSSVNTAFYVGIITYSTSTYTGGSVLDAGTTASAVVQTITTNAAVAEILNFCVGSTVVDDTTTSPATDCTGVAGTSINLGTLDTTSINISPVTINGGDSQNAVAMVRSNAGNGVVVNYDAVQQTGTNHVGTLRISGGTCSVANTLTDPCINAAGTTQTTFTAGTEKFGMTVAGINSGSTSSYSCTYGTPPGNTCNLEPQTNYLGQGSAGSTEAYGTGNGFAWDESGAAVPIASSAASTVKQVDDESLILKFAATPSITTPFGPYAAKTDFIAVPTY